MILGNLVPEWINGGLGTIFGFSSNILFMKCFELLTTALLRLNSIFWQTLSIIIAKGCSPRFPLYCHQIESLTSNERKFLFFVYSLSSSMYELIQRFSHL